MSSSSVLSSFNFLLTSIQSTSVPGQEGTSVSTGVFGATLKNATKKLKGEGFNYPRRTPRRKRQCKRNATMGLPQVFEIMGMWDSKQRG
jgi:hypothetical protein